MNERQVTPVANGVKCGGGFRQVFANDAGIADLFVAERELVVRKANRSRVMRQLGMLECARVQRDRT